jgi:pyruvate/2-oxoglutarate dehydrogenase complex dihydrolipoamide dehydrogenase (E3) component/uncharacterized membrane protein YdjX (TVP38/TMEM64 family)
MRGRLLKIMVLLIALSCVIVAWSHGLFHFLTLENLKARQSDLDSWYHARPLAVIAAYAGIYILVAALSLPGAAVLTLAGGALFGVLVGTLIVSWVSVIGATCAFLVSRFVLRNWVEQRFGQKLQGVNAGLEKEGAVYLLTLRLVPIFPFFLVNLLMGLTRVRVLTFFVVSQIGMLPGTLVYVNAGTQLAKITSLKGIASPRILLSFALLGIFPVIAKRGLDYWESGRALRKFQKPKVFDYNFIVIGAGSAGLVASYIGAAIKARVALIEKHKMGGDCLNTGCVPSKALIRSARFLADARRAEALGMRKATVDYQFSDVMERVQRVVRKVEPHDSTERYTKLGVECFSGEAEVLSPYTVRVNGQVLTTRNIILATGAHPRVPPIPGLKEMRHWTSDTIWSLRVQPKRLLVLGGGPIGCELAQAFQRLGSQVTLVEGGKRILPKEDEAVSDFMQQCFEREGIRVLLEHHAERFEAQEGVTAVYCKKGLVEVRVEFDEVLVSLGREANVTGFGLEKLGLTLTKHQTIGADEYLRTHYSNIYVCGDATGPYQFTHMAAHQAWFAAVNALFSPFKRFKVDYRIVPWTTFTDPEVARVGLSEAEAKAKKIPYEVTRYDLAELDRAITEHEDHGFIQVLTVPGKDKILGVTIVGAHAGDYLSEYVLAMKYGIGLNKILGTIHVYPTFAEANKYVAGNWKKAHAPQAALGILAKFHAWRRGHIKESIYGKKLL